MKTEPRLTMTGGGPPAAKPTAAAGGAMPRPAAPTQPPASAAAPHAAPASTLAGLAHQPWFVAALVAVVLLLALHTVRHVWHKGGSAPAPISAFHQGGVQRAHDLPRLEAASLRKAADEIEQTETPLTEIKAKHVDRSGDAREQEFDDLFVKHLDAIIKPGEDHPTKEQRARYAAALRMIADAEEGLATEPALARFPNDPPARCRADSPIED